MKNTFLKFLALIFVWILTGIVTFIQSYLISLVATAIIMCFACIIFSVLGIFPTILINSFAKCYFVGAIPIAVAIFLFILINSYIKNNKSKKEKTEE